jgi:hypothetical protein
MTRKDPPDAPAGLAEKDMLAQARRVIVSVV